MNPVYKRVYQIHDRDNVATALDKIEPGKVKVGGSTEETEIVVLEPIPAGHKISLNTIEKGQNIIKYGVPIGEAIQKIPKGAWVHLHNIRSLYDQRSQHMDVITGAPKDTEYK